MKRILLTALVVGVWVCSSLTSSVAGELSTKWLLNNTDAAPFGGTAVYDGGLVVIGNNSVLGINANGEQKWIYNASGAIVAGNDTGMIFNNTLLIAEDNYPWDYTMSQGVSLLNVVNGSVESNFSIPGKLRSYVVTPAKILSIVAKSYNRYELYRTDLYGNLQGNTTLLSGYAKSLDVKDAGDLSHVYTMTSVSSPSYWSNLTKYDYSGNKIWKRDFNGSTSKIMIADNGDIIVANNPNWTHDNCTVYSISSSGSLNWSYFQNGTGIVDLQVGPDGTVYLLTSTLYYPNINNFGKLIALDGSGNSTKWEFSIHPETSPRDYKKLVLNGNKLYAVINDQGTWTGAPYYANRYNSTILGISTNGFLQWNQTYLDRKTLDVDESDDGVIYFTGDWLRRVGLLEAALPPRAYVDGDIAPYAVPDARLTADDALVALQCAIGKLETKPNISTDGDVAPLDNSTGVLQPNPDGQVNVGDAVVLLKGSVGQYAWEGMALLNGQQYMANIVTDTPDVSRAFGYQFDVLIGNGGYDPAPGLVNATGSLPSGSSLEGSYNDNSRTLTLGLMSTTALNSTLPVASGLGASRYLLLKFPLPEGVVADSLNKIAIINDSEPDNGFVDNLGASVTSPPIGRVFYLTNENI